MVFVITAIVRWVAADHDAKTAYFITHISLSAPSDMMTVWRWPQRQERPALGVVGALNGESPYHPYLTTVSRWPVSRQMRRRRRVMGCPVMSFMT